MDTWVAPASLQVHTAEIHGTGEGHSFPTRQVPISVTLKLDEVQSLLRALDVPNVQRTGSQAAERFSPYCGGHFNTNHNPYKGSIRGPIRGPKRSLMTLSLVIGG